MSDKPKKLYCYVDETGQDAGSEIFVVVAVVAWDDVESLRLSLVKLERELKVGNKKWHKLRHASRMGFMAAFLRQKFNNLSIYFGRFNKPVPSFFPTFEVIQRSLVSFSEPINVNVSVDGLDAISAKKMTNALRSKHLRLRLVKGPTDESEVLIRLADRWAGCLRLALLNHSKDCEQLIARAEKKGLLKEV
jgi:hypothetical protein